MKTFEEFNNIDNNDKVLKFLKSYFNHYELRPIFGNKVDASIWFNKDKNYYQVSFDVHQLTDKLNENDISDLKTLYKDKIEIYDKAIEYLSKFGKSEKDITSSFGQYKIVFINFYLTSSEILKGIDYLPNDVKSILTMNKFNL